MIDKEQKQHLDTILNFRQRGTLIVLGSAGTGKSTLLKLAQDTDRNAVTVAPTGISA